MLRLEEYFTISVPVLGPSETLTPRPCRIRVGKDLHSLGTVQSPVVLTMEDINYNSVIDLINLLNIEYFNYSGFIEVLGPVYSDQRTLPL